MSKVSIVRAQPRSPKKADAALERETVRLVCMALMLAVVALAIGIARVI